MDLLKSVRFPLNLGDVVRVVRTAPQMVSWKYGDISVIDHQIVDISAEGITLSYRLKGHLELVPILCVAKL